MPIYIPNNVYTHIVLDCSAFLPSLSIGNWDNIKVYYWTFIVYMYIFKNFIPAFENIFLTILCRVLHLERVERPSHFVFNTNRIIFQNLIFEIFLMHTKAIYLNT